MKLHKMKWAVVAGLFAMPFMTNAADNTGFEPIKPDALADYRLSYDEMFSIANSHVLPHRIFYYPSVGENAEWFDAVKKGNLDKVKAMVEAGQSLEVKDTKSGRGQTALGWAAFIGYEDIVKYLIDKGADLYATDDADVKNALKSAALGNSAATAKVIYAALKEKQDGKVDVNYNTFDSDGESLLMIAASNNRVDMVNYLLSIGAKIDIVSEKLQQNALTYACSRGHQQVADILIKNGAVNFKTGKPAC
ncbi:ankyrin repeat domain-containing protein [Aeromonas cavernicola]|uniref:Uncharacterized protein n=1 Tax=Aeromonas cavernicola TaxID=1006623 RepID=A0A2H9U3J6_9GAMM|nr:ankyrin repeat domain-containing protein [Aeromonas cavernicola]PJG58626.1 hypothetical protein CUC53_11665 [Aeromonas cavernicola]